MSVMIATLRKSSRTFGVGYAVAPAAQHELDVRRPPFAVPALDDPLWRKRPARDRRPLGEGADVCLFASEHPFEVPSPHPPPIPEEQEHICKLDVAGYLFGGQGPVPVPAHCFPYGVRHLLVWQVEVLGVEVQRLEVLSRDKQPGVRITQRQSPQVIERVDPSPLRRALRLPRATTPALASLPQPPARTARPRA